MSQFLFCFAVIAKASLLVKKTFVSHAGSIQFLLLIEEKMSLGPVERAGIYRIDQVLPFVVMGKPEHGQESLKGRPQKVYNGKTVHMDSMRYQTFIKSGTVCVACGLKAAYFALERQLRNTAKAPKTRFHFNLYGLADNREVLFTKDHIVPKARGGNNSLENLQTMCQPCNTAKGKDSKATIAFKQSRSRIKRLKHKINKLLCENKRLRKLAYQENTSDGGPEFMALKQRRQVLGKRIKLLDKIDAAFISRRKSLLRDK